jgi:transcriptional regulator with GAF, ATPase, and Fis domain
MAPDASHAPSEWGGKTRPPELARVQSAGLETSPDGFGVEYLTEFAPLLVGQSMLSVRQLIEDVAGTDATVLVLGESGVGKDLVARAIHAASPRRNGPFVKVNCAALPAELLESELFGYEKGAFTGAHRRKLGQFEFANRGTMCLDEIGELPRLLQAKLLHVLQDLQFARIGGDEAIRVDVRIVATTNRDLEDAIARAEFREDLYYRLNVVEIYVPPLRERKDTLAALVAYHLARLNKQYGRHVEVRADTLELFRAYTWPGNVRELENLLRRLVVVGHHQQVHDYLTRRLQASSSTARGTVPAEPVSPPQPVASTASPPVPASAPDSMLDLRALGRRAAEEAERRALVEVLKRVDWNQAKAARILHVSYKTLRNRLADFGLDPPEGRRRTGKSSSPSELPGPT